MTFCTRECPPDCLVEKLEMARRIEELEKQVPVWVDVKDRLPITRDDMQGKCYETADGLFVLTGSSGVVRSDFAAGNTLGYWGKFSYERDVITHWLDVRIPSIAHPNQSIGEQKNG